MRQTVPDDKSSISGKDQDFYNWLRKLPIDVFRDLYRKYTVQRLGITERRDREEFAETLKKVEKNRPPPDEGESVVVLRRSIFFLIGTLITIEIAFDVLYLVFRVSPSLLHLPIGFQDMITPWFIMIFLIFNVLKLLFMIFAAFSWIATKYELRDGEIRFKFGLLFIQERIYIIKYAQEVEFDQSIFGRIFNYGTIQIYNPILKETVYLDAVPSPRKYVNLIKSSMPNPENAQLIPI